MNNMSKSDIESADLSYIQTKAREELNKLSGHSVLFTGADGFLGYYFLKVFLAWNDAHPAKKIKVHALDIFLNGIPKHLRGRSDIVPIKKDITKFKPAVSQKIDYIIHAASIASPIFYRQYPIETINANVLGLYNILNFAVKKQKTPKKVRGLLFFSSSEIYGDPTPEHVPTPENYRGNVSCTGPRACYDESKRFGETLCVNFSQVHKLPIKIARPFNNYGPGLKITDGRVIPDFANDILHDRDINMLSTGSPTRTFCYITDAIVGYIKILIKGKNGESYNIGTEEPEISMLNLAKKIKDIAIKEIGYKGKIILKTSKDKHYLTDAPNRRRPTIAKARKDLGYNPRITLEQGLSNSLLWYKENLL